MPPKPAPTRADVLADLARAYVLEPVHADEVTIDMMMETLAANGGFSNDKLAGKVLRKAAKDGKLEGPFKRASVNGRTVLAWKLKV